MISFCHIVPSAHLKTLDEHSGSYLILEHECRKNPEYRNFFRGSDKFKILDNGAYEKGFPSSLIDLIDMGDYLDVNEIVIPDVFQSAHYTLKHLDDFNDYMSRHPHLKDKFGYMAVAQGRTPEEYLDCLGKMIHNPLVSTIGLSFIVIQKAFRKITLLEDIMSNRLFVTALISMGQRNQKRFHLLGMGNCKELQHQVKHDWIRSADSSTCFVHGLNDITFDKEEGLQQERIKKKLDFELNLPEEDPRWKCIEKNMEVVHGLLQQYT